MTDTILKILSAEISLKAVEHLIAVIMGSNLSCCEALLQGNSIFLKPLLHHSSLAVYQPLDSLLYGDLLSIPKDVGKFLKHPECHYSLDVSELSFDLNLELNLLWVRS